VLYDCANESVARSISRLAKKARLTRTECTVVVQPRAKEIATLTPAIDDGDTPASSSPRPAVEDAEPLQSHEEVQTDRGRAPLAVPVKAERPVSPPATPRPATPEEVAERERRYRKLLGIPEPKPRRRWLH
jgi:hypothetical protein